MSTTTKIETLAAECAREALDQGATAPWGDGDTCLDGDFDALVELLNALPTVEQFDVWDAAFRAAVDAGLGNFS